MRPAPVPHRLMPGMPVSHLLTAKSSNFIQENRDMQKLPKTYRLRFVRRSSDDVQLYQLSLHRFAERNLHRLGPVSSV